MAIRRRIDPNYVTPTGLLSKKAQKILDVARTVAADFDNLMFGEMYIHAVEQKIAGNPHYLNFMAQLREPPVSIEDFLDSSDFMGATDLVLWPEVRKAVVGINKDWWRGQDIAKVEAVLCGATATGKCLPGFTEFLTPTGWKRIDEYSPADVVGQYEVDGTVSFVKPTSYIDQPNVDGFYRVQHRTMFMQVTPNHRVIYESKRGNLMEQTADSVVYIHKENDYGWNGKIPATFGINNEGLLLSDDEIRLMVAVMADGCFKGNGRSGSRPNYCRFHLRKERKVNRLKSLLGACGISYNEYLRLADGYVDIAFLAPQINKEYVGWWAANQEQLHVIRDELLYWDGSHDKQEFYTSLEHVADFIQYVAAATGSKATINVVDRRGQTYNNHTRKSKEFTVRFHGTAHHRISKGGYGGKAAFVLDNSEEREYCFTVPSGMFVVRQNGYIFVTGNSEISKVTLAYHAHILGCMKAPQSYYGLPQATSIVFIIQAAKPHVTKKVIYMPLRTYIETMPWFQRHMRPDKLLEAEMYFPDQNIRIVQGGADSDAVLGEAIIGGIIDEINFMNVVEKSKKAGIGTGRSGTYDQAQSVYDTITRRRKGRFLSQGPQVGCICVASSTRYKNDFTDRRKQQVADLGLRTVYIYDKAQYDVWPASRYCGDRFSLLVTNENAMDIRILEEGEKVLDGTVLEIPVEYREDFLRDAPGALRDVVGTSVNSINPFFRQQHKIMECVHMGEAEGLESFLQKDNVVLAYEGLPMPQRGHFCRNPSKPRYVHIDLSITSDRCGVAMVRYDGIQWVERNEAVGPEPLPIATVEMAVTFEPDHGNEIDVAEVRTWVKMLRNTYGYPIKAVTYDGYQSIESRQAWKRHGMKTGAVSVDRSSAPYKQFRDAVYDGRVKMYHQPVLLEELFGLEYDEKADKIDHPVNGTKDCISGDTEIPLLDGSCRRIDSLVGEEFWVYSSTPEGRVTAGRAHNVHKVGTKPIICVYLDNGEYLKCTEDHEIMLRDGSFTLAGRLKPGDSLMSLYTEVSVANSKNALSNHKVVRIEVIDTPVDVYDMTVDVHHNFAIKQGIFVHNCADAVCGAYHTLLNRASSWVLPTGGDMRDSDRADLGERADYDQRS